ncbi:MAG: J domain-containing protein [Verrucomicrobiaceae bacterium]|nr:J domain-containing protein [Verrucomicrobiaceae bacterium]
MRTHYDSLKVTEDAPPEVIRAAYRALSLKYHPDRCGGSAQSQRMMQSLNEAYAVLSDSRKRAGYDGDLLRQRQPRTTSRPPENQTERRVKPARHGVRLPLAPRPVWLKSGLALLSDARLVVPVVAVIWWIVYRRITHG